MGKLVDSLSGEFAKDWLLRVLSPAFVFWTVGALAVTGRLNSFDAFQKSLDPFATQGETHWIPVLVAALIWIAASAWLMDRATFPATRLLEGYWPNLCGLWRWRVAAAQARYDAIYDEWGQLAALPQPSIDQLNRKIKLDHILRHCPTRDRILPTRLGNILCASETRPIGKYGLDAVTCWPRMWLLLSKESQEEITAIRATMDDGVRLLLWSALSAVWAYWDWWLILFSIVAVFVSHHVTIAAATNFADIVESVFDTRRMLLYDALGWPKPKMPAEEKALGEALTRYLLRGSDSLEPRFEFAKDNLRSRTRRLSSASDQNLRP
jgi:hypothetical protein